MIGRANQGVSIPDNWRTLNVHETFGIRGMYSSDLRIVRKKGRNIQAEFLPTPEEDPRPNQGRSKGGKRLNIQKGMGTMDPILAAERAIEWNKKTLDHNITVVQNKVEEANKSLQNYWDVWFAEECSLREGDPTRKFSKWKRDTLRIWNNDISDEEWSQKDISLITKKNLEKLFKKLESRALKNEGTNGRGTQEDARRVINHLFSEAEDDFHGHAFPKFPKVKKHKKQVTHFRREQWETLLRCVVELSKGACMEHLSEDEYHNLEFSEYHLSNQRNWVDLHDAMLVQWYFYTRARDLDRVQMQWFEPVPRERKVICKLLDSKTGDIEETESYRSDAIRFWERISKRRGKSGYIMMPRIERPNERKVVRTLNTLLKRAIAECLPDFPNNNRDRCWTTIRHTAFRLTLEEMPELGQYPAIKQFAKNGGTSDEMLKKTYLDYIGHVDLGKKARSTIKEGISEIFFKKRVRD
ncbi:MAG: hypothetical protein CMK47_01345 [Prochlorococcus sp. MED105]|nr:hypothetical protein [Prochlorococcus sp. MED105]